MRLFFCSLLLIPVLCLKAQPVKEIGVNAGILFYNGDINESKLFYNPTFNKGVLLRYCLNDRYSLKLNLNHGFARGNSADFSDLTQIIGNISFQSEILDLALQAEFNFLPYHPFWHKEAFISPYVFGGLGVFVVNWGRMGMILPFGIGLKYRLSKRIGIAAGFSFRKTFDDELIDNTVNIIQREPKPSVFINNDWYSITNVIVTYNITKVTIKCPAYKDMYR